ncbi:hypothetical protein [Streptomyces sp. NPDC020917]|uniref:hypothetical protein n=1 Tax=Streptomyces sp. NPDC020917 TaxID=3365102 RepID=UPI0037AA3048
MANVGRALLWAAWFDVLGVWQNGFHVLHFLIRTAAAFVIALLMLELSDRWSRRRNIHTPAPPPPPLAPPHPRFEQPHSDDVGKGEGGS